VAPLLDRPRKPEPDVEPTTEGVHTSNQVSAVPKYLHCSRADWECWVRSTCASHGRVVATQKASPPRQNPVGVFALLFFRHTSRPLLIIYLLTYHSLSTFDNRPLPQLVFGRDCNSTTRTGITATHFYSSSPILRFTQWQFEFASNLCAPPHSSHLARCQHGSVMLRMTATTPQGRDHRQTLRPARWIRTKQHKIPTVFTPTSLRFITCIPGLPVVLRFHHQGSSALPTLGRIWLFQSHLLLM
jgi:hypothetical protein